MAEEQFEPDLLEKIKAAVATGDVIPTFDRGNPNTIGTISAHGIKVTTTRSGGPLLIPAWMFDVVWQEIVEHGSVSRAYVDRERPGRKVKRSSAVFAILERLPDVEVSGRRPLVLSLRA